MYPMEYETNESEYPSRWMVVWVEISNDLIAHMDWQHIGRYFAQCWTVIAVVAVDFGMVVPPMCHLVVRWEIEVPLRRVEACTLQAGLVESDVVHPVMMLPHSQESFFQS